MRESTQGYLVAIHTELCKMCPADCNGFNLDCLYHMINLASIMATKYSEMRDGNSCRRKNP